MGNRVKGIVVEIGGDTTGLDKALQGTNKVINSTQSELKDVNRLLKMDPTNTKLLEQKQRLLAKAVEETGNKLATLEDASKQVAATAKNYDAWKAAYDPIQKEITDTSKKLADLKSKQKDLEEVGETNTDAYKEITEEVKTTAKALQNLKTQAKDVADEFGNPISPEQFDRLQREIEATKLDMRKLENEAGDVSRKIGKIDDNSIRDVDDAAEDAEESLKKAGKQASTFGEVLKAEIVADGLKSVAENLKDVSEESKEYRKIMASLDVSSAKNGYTAEKTSEAYKKLYGILSDEQSAATTLANLQAIGLTQSQLMGLIDTTVGAWAQYGDSIPIDGLAEAINETIKTGQVTGNLADVLNWGAKAGETYGVTMKAATEENEAWNQSVADAKTAEDYFNLALQGCSSETERANKVLQMLANQGLTNSGKAWQENNQSLIESNRAQADMQEQLAELGETVEPLFTRITNLVAGVLKWFNSLDESSQTLVSALLVVTAILGPLGNAFAGATKMAKGLSTAFGFLAAHPIVLLIAAIVGAVVTIGTCGDKILGVFLRIDEFLQNFFVMDWCEIFGPVLGELLNGFFAHINNVWTSIRQIFVGVIDFVRGVFTLDWERAWQGVLSIFEGIFSGLKAKILKPINAVFSVINAAIGGINALIEKANGIPGVDISWRIPKLPMLASGGEVLQGSAIVGEAGPELLTVANGRTIVQPLGSSSTTNHNSTHLGGVQIVVYGAPGQDVETLADIIMDRMQTACDIKGAAL